MLRLERGLPFLVAIALPFVDACGSSNQSGGGFGGTVAFGGSASRPMPPAKGGCPSFVESRFGRGSRFGRRNTRPGRRRNTEHVDLDSDNDGVSDRDELEGPFACTLRDCDADGAADTEDTDSDNDLLLDGTERSLGLSACLADTDGDGCQDLADLELGGCDSMRSFVMLCSGDAEPPEAVVRMRALTAAERLEPHLEIIKLANGFEPEWIESVRPVDVSPMGAGSVEAGGFSNVSSDAALTVAVKLTYPPNRTLESPWALIAVRAYASNGHILAEGFFLTVIEDCARRIPI